MASKMDKFWGSMHELPLIGGMFPDPKGDAAKAEMNRQLQQSAQQYRDMQKIVPRQRKEAGMAAAMAYRPTVNILDQITKGMGGYEPNYSDMFNTPTDPNRQLAQMRGARADARRTQAESDRRQESRTGSIEAEERELARLKAAMQMNGKRLSSDEYTKLQRMIDDQQSRVNNLKSLYGG